MLSLAHTYTYICDRIALMQGDLIKEEITTSNDQSHHDHDGMESQGLNCLHQ